MQATKTAAKGPSKHPVHILVVDDERSICELLEITFRKEGHRVEVAHDVPAAKRKLESQIFDIVISDGRMPGESGVDLLKLTKEIAPQCFFLLITGVPTVETAIAAINSGADRYVITDHELVDQLRRAVREVSGYWKGALTGGADNRKGLFQAAHGGTLFMDEIGNMSLTMQVKLYRVLQEGKVRPVGSNEETDVDVRIIAATNKNFEKEIAEGRFREDLYYRLSVIPIQLPPLRERREDIPLLARHFLETFRKSMEKPINGISPEAMRQLEAYEWPGNVRELENTMERAVALESSSEISLPVLPDRIAGYSGVVAAAISGGHLAIPAPGIEFEKEMADAERRYLQSARDSAHGVPTRAAHVLQITYRSFRHYAKKHNI